MYIFQSCLIHSTITSQAPAAANDDRSQCSIETRERDEHTEAVKILESTTTYCLVHAVLGPQVAKQLLQYHELVRPSGLNGVPPLE